MFIFLLQFIEDVTHTEKNIFEQQIDGKLITKCNRSFSHSTSKKFKQSDNTILTSHSFDNFNTYVYS